MVKSDLKDGMVVESRDGERFILMGDHFRNYNGCFGVYIVNEDLTHNSECRGLDILKVYTHAFGNYTINDMFRELQLVWERKEETKPKLSKDEKVILSNILKKYKYIARDRGGDLFIYKNKPIKNYSVWNYDDNSSCELPYNHLFQMVQWSDDEPTLIKDLLNEEE